MTGASMDNEVVKALERNGGLIKNIQGIQIDSDGHASVEETQTVDTEEWPKTL